MSASRFLLALTLLASIHASAQTIATTAAGGCDPDQGRIIQKICEPGEPTAATLVWEDDQVKKWLALHGLPESDVEKVYKYGRSELRNELRNYLFNEMMVTASARYGGNQFLNWYERLLWEKEKAYWQHAVDEKNVLMTNACAFRPDPDIAAKFNLVYNYQRFCSGATFSSLTSTPRIPSKDYFRASAMRAVYAKGPEKAPGAGDMLVSMLADQLGLNAIIHGAGVASGGVSGTVMSRDVAMKKLFPKLSSEAKRAAKNTSNLSIRRLKEISRGARFLRSAGPGIVISLAIEAGLAAGMEAAQNEENLRELNSLDDELTRINASTFAPPLSSVMNQDQGFFKLNTVWLDLTSPEFDSKEPLPSLPSNPLTFSLRGESGPALLNAQMNWIDWADTKWTGYYVDGWIAGSAVNVHNENYEAFSPTIRFRTWEDKQYTAVVQNRRFVVIRDTDFDGRACGADTLLGVTQPSDVPTCKSYVTNEVQLKSRDGANITISIPEKPQFTSGSDFIGFTKGVASSVDFTTSGSPIPSLTLGGALSPFVFTSTGPGAGRISYDGTPVPDTTKVVRFRAVSGGETVERLVTIALREAPQITSPNTLDIHVGIPVNFRVVATGSLPINFEMDGSVLPPGITLTNNNDGTATIAGTFEGQNQPSLCFRFDGTPCGLRAIPAFGSTVRQPFTVNIIPPPAPQIPGGTTFEMIEGVPNEIEIVTTGARTKVHFGLPSNCASGSPSWLSIVDHGDGTATLKGIPPINSQNAVEYPFFLDYWAESGYFRFGCSPLAVSNARIRALPIPQITGPDALTVDANVNFAGFNIRTNQKFGTGRASAVINGRLPTGVTGDFNPSFGVALGGKPAVGTGGVYPVDIQITNPFTRQVIGYTLTVLEPPTFVSESEVQLLANEPASFLVETTGYPLDTMVLTMTGTLPGAMTFTPIGGSSASATIEGNPGGPGTRTVTITAKNDEKPSYTKQQTLTLRVVAQGDANGDTIFNCADITLVRAHLGSRTGTPEYDIRADLDRNGIVNLKDVALAKRLVREHGGALCL